MLRWLTPSFRPEQAQDAPARLAANTVAERKVAVRAAAASAVAALGLGLAACSPAGEDIVMGVPDEGRGTFGGPRLDEDLAGALSGKYVEQLEDIEEDPPTVATRVIPAAKRVNLLRQAEINMTFGCVGELLDELDPAKAKDLREMYAKEEHPDRVMWRDITHSTMLSALPSDLEASNPGMAVICADDTLPQNIVALWRKPLPDRYENRAANNVAGGVSTETLKGASQKTP